MVSQSEIDRLSRAVDSQDPLLVDAVTRQIQLERELKQVVLSCKLDTSGACSRCDVAPDCLVKDSWEADANDDTRPLRSI